MSILRQAKRIVALCGLAMLGACAPETGPHSTLTDGVAASVQRLSDTLFSDGFEDGLTQWAVTGDCTTSTRADRTGSRGARCEDASSLTATIDLQGASEVQIAFSWRTSGYYEASEFAYADYSLDAGIHWLSLESTQSSTFVDRVYDLSGIPSGADLLLRFSSNANGTFERFDLDDVAVTAELSGTPSDDSCDGVDQDNDGQFDEDYPAQPTTCGTGACGAVGAQLCQGGLVVDTCAPGSPVSEASLGCNGVDDDCDGQTDEGLTCGPQTHVRMEPTAGDYFGMPWPSDHRRRSDGRPDLSGFPGVDRGLIGIGAAALGAAQEAVEDFGLNSAAFFTLTGDLNSDALPQGAATTADNSPAMIVNLDDTAAPRIPLMLDYKSAAGSARPGRLLAVMPYPGFGLDPATRYGVILFGHLPTVGGQLAPAPLLAQLDGNDVGASGLGSADFALLKQQRDEVSAYVASKTSLSAADVVAFAVFTTQALGVELDAVADRLSAMSDAEVRSRVRLMDFDEADATFGGARRCGTCTAGSPCPAARLYAEVDMPIFIKPVEFSYRRFCALFGGDDCVSTAGGEIEINQNGLAQLQPSDLSVTPMQIRVPCDGQRPPNGWPVLFHAAGTGGNERSVWESEKYFTDAGHSLQYVAASVTPWGTAPRHDAAIAETVVSLVGTATGNEDPDTANGYMYTFLFNPVVAANNPVQAAADAWFSKRVVSLLAELAQDSGVDSDDWNLPAGGFVTDGNRSMLQGQSQGSTSGPLSLAISAARGGYNDAFLNATAAHLLTEFIPGRTDTRSPFEAVFQIPDNGELDRFHPLMHFFQSTTEVGRGGNYARRVETENLLITQGFSDACSLREDANAIATELYRHGKIEAVETSGDFSHGVMPTIDGIETVLGVAPTGLPMSGNLAGGGTGAYVMVEGDHGAGKADPEAGQFMSDRANGVTPTLTSAPFSGDINSDFICEEGKNFRYYP